MTEVKVNGYHGGFSSNVDNIQLQNCSSNEVDGNFRLNEKASLDSDEASINNIDRLSVGPGLYKLDNTYGCDCNLEEARNVQLSQPNINFTAGYGWMGENVCKIENDSSLRTNTLTNMKYINQLDNPLNNGFFGKGPYDVDSETKIINSISVKEDRACGPLSGVSTYDYTITPMIEKLNNEIQNTKHIIPEDSMDSWIRGGIPSRQIIRNTEYLKRISGDIN